MPSSSSGLGFLGAHLGSWESGFFNGFGYASEKEVTKYEKMIQKNKYIYIYICIYIYKMTCTWCTLTKRNSKCFQLRKLKRYSSVAALDPTCQVMRHVKDISKNMRQLNRNHAWLQEKPNEAMTFSMKTRTTKRKQFIVQGEKADIG